MGNRERIVIGAIELMNLHGSNIGTSHLAEHLNISPGNLYYHFRNREEILDEVLSRLQRELTEVLEVDSDAKLSAERVAGYFLGGADVLWRYRFFFSSSIELVCEDPQLREHYKAFTDNGITQVCRVVRTAVDAAPGELRLSSNDCQIIAENIWVLWTNWPRYFEVTTARELTRQDVNSGLEHIAIVLKPYLNANYFRRVIRELRNP